MIVSTLVDECMPLKHPKENFKIIDVSCGSGIFLVKTYKRIVQWWRYNKWKKTGKLVKPSLSVLKELLLKSIHGIDIEQDAIRLSVFSLALAILDEVDLDPPTWGKLKFPDLSRNIITQNFFNFITKKSETDFDLVIGNPPFNLPPVNGKEPNRKNYFKELLGDIGYKSEINIPDENPALHFLVQSVKLLKQDALLCLIQPSGPILYQKDQDFKQELFSQNNLIQVVDFTKLADKLWGRKNVSTAAVFIQNKKPDGEDVLHLIANKTFSNSNRLFLEFDHYDFHFVPKNSVINNPYVWKTNLFGGGRTVQLIDDLSKIETIDDFINEKKSIGWVAGEGFIASKNGTPCSYISGKKFLPTKAFTEKGIDYSLVNDCDFEGFHRPRNRKIYEAPHLLIKANLGRNKLLAEFSDEYLVFKDKIIGIHSPENEKTELIRLSRYLNDYSKLLRFYLISTSSQVAISRATALIKQDIMQLPYPNDLNKLNLSEANQILIDDIIEYYSVNSVKLEGDAKSNNVKKFSSIFCKTLNSIYQQDKLFQLFKIIDTGNYYALHFEYTNEIITPKQEEITDLEQYIENVIPTRNDNQPKVHIQRIIKAYGKDSIILAKPKQLRYWLPSIALRDADETFADYIKSRYYNA